MFIDHQSSNRYSLKNAIFSLILIKKSNSKWFEILNEKLLIILLEIQISEWLHLHLEFNCLMEKKSKKTVSYQLLYQYVWISKAKIFFR